ncbi:hypothetical protein ABW09_12255 [Pluralibacter gergoviae]|uniref:hypothetical protein n=1 Tax=Pluralibacter gergoviae TaxID=61647 RepID=UPI000650FBC0|nr:hypothetical protein [Pluralibacter gergoviae]KMK17810.1 hypothetical protein ABW09_12255 [Pluralibacter gergoviae]
MSNFIYDIEDNLLKGIYTNGHGLDFQSQVKLSDYDSELMAAAAAQVLGEQYSKKYEETMNDEQD